MKNYKLKSIFQPNTKIDLKLLNSNKNKKLHPFNKINYF